MSNPKPSLISQSGSVVDPLAMHGQMDVVSKTADYTIVEGDTNVVFLANKTSGNQTFHSALRWNRRLSTTATV
jgi:hypothetical protein